MTHRSTLQALIMRVFLLAVAFCLVGATPAPDLVGLLAKNIDAKRPMQVLYQIESLAAQSGWTADLATTAGDIWEGLDDLPRAAAFWEVASHLQPPDQSLVRRLAQAYLELGHWSQAVITLSRVVESTDDNWAHFQLGLLQSVYDTSAATEHFNLAVRDPQFKPIITQLLPLMTESSDFTRALHMGTVLASNGYWPAAEYTFNYAASMRPIVPEALAYAGLARDQQGKNGQPQIDQAVALAPDSGQVRYLQGLHYQLLGDQAASLNALLQSTRLAPLNPAFAAELATTYDRLGDTANAEYWYKAAVTLSNNDARFQALLDTFYNQPSTTFITAIPSTPIP